VANGDIDSRRQRCAGSGYHVVRVEAGLVLRDAEAAAALVQSALSK
jgi:hypothetical protein